jgi:hypothetical protein
MSRRTPTAEHFFFSRELHLSSPSRKIDHVLRDSEKRNVFAQALEEADPLCDREAEMRRAPHRIRMVEIIRVDADGKELAHQEAQHGRIVVDVPQQDGLAAERNSGVRE